MAKFACMELESCLISDPCLIKSSKEVFLFAQKTAEDSNLLTTDLILATVWHCINNSRQIHRSPDNDKANGESGDKSKSVSGENSITKQNGDRVESRHGSIMSNDIEDNQMEPHITHNSIEASASEKLIPVLPVDAGDRRNTESESDRITLSNIPTINDDKTGSKDVSNNEVDSAHCSNKECVILNADVPDIVRVGSEPDIKSKLFSHLDKNIRHLNETMANGHKTNKAEDVTMNGNSKKAVELREQSSSVDSVPTKTTTSLTNLTQTVISEEKDKVKNGNKGHQLLADVFEIINIDDEDSNDANGGSKQETTANTENTSKEEKAEAEPDYFDMDCDEIDDEVDYEEMLDTSKDSEITDHSPRILSKAEETKSKCIESVKGLDVTIISDDEDLEVLDLGKKANIEVAASIVTMPSARSSMSIAGDTFASTCNVMEAIKTPGKEKRCSKRKQIHTNVKVDYSEHLQEKTGVKSPSETTGSHDESAASGFTCPVMDDLDNMSMATQGTGLVETEDSMSQDPLKSNSDTAQPSAVTVLGLVPVGDVHKSDNQLVCSEDDHSAVPIMPTLSSNESIYVSSAMMHGSIPSLPSVSALHHVSNMPGSRSADIYQSDPVTLCETLASTSSTFQYDPGLQTQSEFESIAQPAVSIAQSDGFGSPPRKKRLLDHDKKWHLQPKYSPEQDKYLALPGGVDGISVEERDGGGGADWRQAGKYTSISEYPSIGIESVDSDFINYHEGYYQSPNQNFNDTCSSYIDESDEIDSVREHSADNTSLVRGYLGSIKRRMGSGTRGRGRGRPRGHGNRNSSSASTRGKIPAGSKGRGRGAVKHGRGKRGRSKGRGSVGTRRGMGGRGKSVKLSTPKKETRDGSPSKFSALMRGKGISSHGRKIGFYSQKLLKSKNTPDSAAKRGSKGIVRRGRGKPPKQLLHNVNIKAEISVGSDVEGASSSADQSSKRGVRGSRAGRRTLRGHKTKAGKQSKNVIVID